MEHFAFFDFGEKHFLVRYFSENEIGDEIEDAISSYADDHWDSKYSDVVKDVMDSFNVRWEIVKCRKYWI